MIHFFSDFLQTATWPRLIFGLLLWGVDLGLAMLAGYLLRVLKELNDYKDQCYGGNNHSKNGCPQNPLLK